MPTVNISWSVLGAQGQLHDSKQHLMSTTPLTCGSCRHELIGVSCLAARILGFRDLGSSMEDSTSYFWFIAKGGLLTTEHMSALMHDQSNSSFQQQGNVFMHLMRQPGLQRSWVCNAARSAFY